MTKAISIIDNNWQVLVTRASNKLIDCFKLRHSVFSEELRWVKQNKVKWKSISTTLPALMSWPTRKIL